jgi:hypothetical protein
MGKNRGRTRRAQRKEETEGVSGMGATRGGWGAPDGRHGAGAAETGAGRVTREQGRRGSGHVGPT